MAEEGLEKYGSDEEVERSEARLDRARQVLGGELHNARRLVTARTGITEEEFTRLVEEWAVNQ